MATAMISLATRTAIRPDVAMTGEIKLSGRVLPVGGVRDKALGALRAGITTVILPRQNLQDPRNLPKELKRRMTFIPVAHMDEVLDVALEWGAERRPFARAVPSAGLSPASIASVTPKSIV